MAFLAVIKAIDPSLVDMKQALEDSMRENLEKAFRVAHEALHIPRLLEPEGDSGSLPFSFCLLNYLYYSCDTRRPWRKTGKRQENRMKTLLCFLYFHPLVFFDASRYSLFYRVEIVQYMYIVDP